MVRAAMHVPLLQLRGQVDRGGVISRSTQPEDYSIVHPHQRVVAGWSLSEWPDEGGLVAVDVHLLVLRLAAVYREYEGRGPIDGLGEVGSVVSAHAHELKRHLRYLRGV